MFPLFPYKYLVFDTTINRKLAISRLSEITDLYSPWFWDRRTTKFFQGNISDKGFQIHRVIRYRNSWLPFLYGKFIKTNHGTRIVIHMTFHPFIMCFMLFALVSSTYEMISHPNSQSGYLIFWLILGAVTILAFGFEAVKAEKQIRLLYEDHLLDSKR